MFSKLKRKTEFLAITDKDLFFALLKGQGGAGKVSDQAFETIQNRCQKFELFTKSVKDLQRHTCFLIVVRGAIRFAGVLHNPDGVSKTTICYDIAQTAPGLRKSLTVFECFWSDNLFWKKFVIAVINKDKIGDEYWQTQIEQEQSSTQVTTNIGGWVNGQTWATQASRNREMSDFIGGGHRGVSDIENVSDLGAVNF